MKLQQRRGAIRSGSGVATVAPLQHLLDVLAAVLMRGLEVHESLRQPLCLGLRLLELPFQFSPHGWHRQGREPREPYL